MHPFLDYILKANLLLIFFGLFYLIFLKRETFYQLNRWYFIGSIIVSITAPLVTFTKTVFVEPIPVKYFVNDNETVFINGVVEEPSFLETIDLQQISVYLILFISFILIIRKLFAVAKLYRTIKKLPSLGASNIKITAENKTVYSFYQWIVVPENFFQWQNHKIILDHESIHLNQKHTFDLILIEVVAAVFWFNPLVKLMQRAINTNLEFIVDQKMIETTESVLYQKNLLQFQTQHAIQFVNSYNASEIKNRILQLNSKKSTNMKKLKFLLATPALVAFFALFQIETVAQVKETIEVQEVFEDDDVEDSFYITIHNEYDDAYYARITKMLREKCNLNVTINDLKRNKEGKLTNIAIVCKKNIPSIIVPFTDNSNKPFEPFELHIYKKGTEYVLDLVSDNKVEYGEIILKEEDNTKKKIVVGSYENKKSKDTLSFDENLLRTDRKIFNEVAAKFPIIIDDVLMTKKQLKKFDNKKIKSMTLSFNNVVKNTPTIVLSTNKITTKELVLKKSDINEIKIKGKTASFEDLKEHIVTENKQNEPLRLKSSLYDYATGIVIRPYNPSQPRTIEETYTISLNGKGSNSKRTVYKDASGKILKVEDSNDGQPASSTNSFVTSNIVYVVDGDIVMEDNFRKIDPKDIESVTILKDKKSKERYAATNKEGVMIIKTKAKKEVSLHQKTQALKARELAMKQRNEVVAERNETLLQNRKEIEKRRQQLLKKRNEITEKTENI